MWPIFSSNIRLTCQCYHSWHQRELSQSRLSVLHCWWVMLGSASLWQHGHCYWVSWFVGLNQKPSASIAWTRVIWTWIFNQQGNWLPREWSKTHLINVGGVTKVLLSKELLANASSARQRYQTYLDEEKRKKVEQRRGQKRAAVSDELNDLKDRQKRMKANIEALFKSADDLAEKAESTGKVSFISKSNSMRQSAKESRCPQRKK